MGMPFIKDSMPIARLAVIGNLSVRTAGLRCGVESVSSMAPPVGVFVSPVGAFVWLEV